jgi:hypothetical protein
MGLRNMVHETREMSNKMINWKKKKKKKKKKAKAGFE